MITGTDMTDDEKLAGAAALVQEWVDVNSAQGRHLVAAPDPAFALYDPADHPVFDPPRWNRARAETNCYSHVMGAHGEVLVPGFILKGKDPEKQELADIYNRAAAHNPSVTMDAFKTCVYRGLERDGLMRADNAGFYRPGHYLVALCFTEIALLHTKDFHFLVLNQNGLWSHVDGQNSFVSWQDEYDERIVNPAQAFFGHDTRFDRFYHVPRGGAGAIRQAAGQVAVPRGA